MQAVVEGPAWARPGLDQRDGRYPLAVEAPVLSMVALLAPGVSTLTQYARYYGLYWALADRAENEEWDAGQCRQVLRRAEVVLAQVSHDDDPDGPQAHGVDALLRGRSAGRSWWDLAEPGKGSYSPRSWGFWSQYGGPSDVLGTATTRDGALRSARHGCPAEVTALFAPLLDLAATGKPSPVSSAWSSRLDEVALSRRDTPDLDGLSSVFTGTTGGRYDPDLVTVEDRTRRSTLRILARALTLRADAAGPVAAMRGAVAYGAAAEDDSVLRGEDRTPAWRGLLLRHRSVGAWRRLWAGLVDHVHDEGLVTRAQLHDWAADRLPGEPVAVFERALPPLVDDDGHPWPAEDAVLATRSRVEADVAVLALGARREPSLSGGAQVAFRGGLRVGRGTFLDPTWVRYRLEEHADRPVRELGRTLVDDMLAQSRRVALRKVRFEHDRLQMFSRLHERNGTYVAPSREGDGNVGLRLVQLATLAEQLGLIGDASAPGPTSRGAERLGLPS